MLDYKTSPYFPAVWAWVDNDWISFKVNFVWMTNHGITFIVKQLKDMCLSLMLANCQCSSKTHLQDKSPRWAIFPQYVILKKLQERNGSRGQQQQWGVTVKVTNCAPLNPPKYIQLYCALLSCGKLLTLCAAWNQITVEIFSDWPLHWNNIWVCLAAL